MSARLTPRSLNSAEAFALEARFGLRVAARLSEQAEALPHDITERLRVAREQAVARARPARAAASVTAASAGSLTLTLGEGPGESWWWRFGALVPLAVLVAGLVAVNEWRSNEDIAATAEIDAALLSDAVPPSAYTDPGFAEFLKAPASRPLE